MQPELERIDRRLRTAAAPAFAKLDDLSARLTVGIQFADYVTRVGDVASAALVLPSGAPDTNNLDCVLVFHRIQAAVDALSDAAVQWRLFIRNQDYAADSKRAADWQTAIGAIAAARAALEAIRTHAMGVSPAPS